jgi:predicted DCC family thiol-disulfide oxidoreductase YuxK
MGGWFRMLHLLKWVPRPIRDSIYRLIAGNRYGLFGKQDQCWLPRPEWRERFVD